MYNNNNRIRCILLLLLLCVLTALYGIESRRWSVDPSSCRRNEKLYYNGVQYVFISQCCKVLAKKSFEMFFFL